MDKAELQQLTDSVTAHKFGGDAAAHQAAEKESYRELIHWKDIEANANTYPELESAARILIEDLLGYLPPPYLILPHEPFVRGLLHSFRSGGISWEDVWTQAEEHIKPIRNGDMERHSDPRYSDHLRERYETHLPFLRQKAKDRLTKFLGYEPQKAHSLTAEIMMRSAMADDKCYLPDTVTNTDLQLITIIKYREVLLTDGKEAADASPLIAVDIKALDRLNLNCP